MSRYIDADEACLDAEERGFDFWTSYTDIENVQKFLDEQTTADVEPVRHGRWICIDDYAECSLCERLVPNIRYHYCPNCGAKMGEENVN